MKANLTVILDNTSDKSAAAVFASQLAALGVALPLSTRTGEIGVIFDASGRDVATIDSNGNLDDATAGLIAGYIVLATNMAGGVPVPRIALSTELDAMLSDWRARADRNEEHA